jgi:hypothetical protein
LSISAAPAGWVSPPPGRRSPIRRARRYDNGQTDEGRAYVYLGGAEGIRSGDPATAGAQLESNQAGAYLGGTDEIGFGLFGVGVASAGDVNGDGYGDVIVGAPYYDAGESEEGAAFVFLGSPSGISSGNPGTANTLIQSNQTGANLGNSVAGAGDVNGDGYADVIVSAERYHSGETNEGAVFVFLGSTSGIASGNPSTAASQLESNQAYVYLGGERRGGR